MDEWLLDFITAALAMSFRQAVKVLPTDLMLSKSKASQTLFVHLENAAAFICSEMLGCIGPFLSDDMMRCETANNQLTCQKTNVNTFQHLTNLAPNVHSGHSDKVADRGPISM